MFWDLVKHPKEFTLYTVVAYRASRMGDPTLGLQPCEAFLGDFKTYGMTRQQYRTCVTHLVTWGYLTIRSTTKGTIAKLTSDELYDINSQESNHQSNQQLTINQPTPNHQVTTNNNVKNEKKEKNANKYTQDSDEILLSEKLWANVEARVSRKQKPDMQKWAVHIDRLIRLNGSSASEISDVIDWVEADQPNGTWPGWGAAILSTQNLREKWDKIMQRFKKKEKSLIPDFAQQWLKENPSG